MSCFTITLLVTTILMYLVIFCDGVPVMINETIEIRRENEFDNDSSPMVKYTFSSDDPERVDIFYNASELREIDQDILQVIGNAPTVTLTCSSTKNSSSFITWAYHGSGKSKNKIRIGENNDVQLLLTSGPPVVRLECILGEEKRITNNTLIYTGEDKPPYLYNHGTSVKAKVINETTANLPCIMNYPLDNNDWKELQLFKGDELVENKNNCLSYTPEEGYFLNLTKLDTPLGKYKCRVINSTEDDYVSVDLMEEDFIRLNYKGNREFFWKGSDEEQLFQCALPKSIFEDKFQWFFLWNNGSYLPIPDSVMSAKYQPFLNSFNSNIDYSAMVGITFSSVNITHVVCAGTIKDTSKAYNHSYPVYILEAYQPDIRNDPLKGPVIYSTGKNLTCVTTGDPIEWDWLKNGKPINGEVNITDYYGGAKTVVKKSTLHLNPSADEKEANYTCIARNFLGAAHYSFRVQLDEKEDGGLNIKTLLITLLIALSFIILIIGLLLIFCKVNVKRRKLDKLHIRNFFEGFGGEETRYNEMEPYASVSYYEAYDLKREIKYSSLIFEKELKGGQFGRVMQGRMVDLTNDSSIPVAIKSIKDNNKRSKEDVEHAFLNFLNEIKMMQGLGHHPNVVGYIGAVTTDIAKYTAYLVVEFCNGGDLSSYLKENRTFFHDDILGLHQIIQSNCSNSGSKNSILKSSHLMKWAEDIAAGMHYVSSKNLLHLDLAARNVLLGYQGINSEECSNLDPALLIAKISDFGLSKNLAETQSDNYQIVFHPDTKNKPRVLPLRWLSIEALEELRFSSESDVWSMGVIFWEMFTLAEITPYKDVIPENSNDLRASLISYLRSGRTLSQPEYSPPEMWEIMSQCWADNPKSRPTAAKVKESLHIINEMIREKQEQFSDSESEIEETTSQIVPNCTMSYSTVGFVENLAYTPSDYQKAPHTYVNEGIHLDEFNGQNYVSTS